MTGGSALIPLTFCLFFYSATHIFSNTQIFYQPKALPTAFYFLVEGWKLGFYFFDFWKVQYISRMYVIQKIH